MQLEALPLAVRGVTGMPWGVSGCGKQALVGNVRDGDLLLGSKPSSSLLILQAVKGLDFPRVEA